MIATATSDGVGIAYRVDGRSDAPPLVLLNSLGADMAMWDPQVPRWARSHRVVRLDQRGHGASAVPPPPYTVDDLGRDAVAVLDRAGVGTADVCGISLGGLVAIWLAAHRPDRVRRAVLASTAARIGDEDGWRVRAETVLVDGMGAVADLVMERFFSSAFRAKHPETVASARATLLATDPSGYAGACLALATADLRARIPSIRAPTLVVAGQADVATPVEDARELQDALPDASLHVIDGAGHLVNLEAPEEFADTVERFLSAAANGPT